MQPSETILAYLAEDHPRNTSVKLFENWSIGLEKISFKGFSIFRSGSHLGIILPISVGSQVGIIPVKSESNWPNSLGGDSI